MANIKFLPKFFLKKEMLARGVRTNGASRKDQWKDASLYLRRCCVKSASQEVVREVAKRLLLVEGNEERGMTLLKNPPFTDQVYQGKYETSVREPRSRSRNRVRPNYGLNDVRAKLLENQLLKHHIDPLVHRGQQIKTILQLDAEAMKRVSSKEDTAKMDTEDNSYAESCIPDERNDGVLDTLRAKFRAAFGAFKGAFCCCFRPRCL